MASASNLETRLRAILDPTIRRRAVRARVVGSAAVAALLVLAPLAALRLHGQAAAGVSGTIYDASGATVPGATGEILNADTGQKQTGATGPGGNYSFRDIPPRPYQLMVSSPGFAVYA